LLLEFEGNFYLLLDFEEYLSLDLGWFLFFEFLFNFLFLISLIYGKLEGTMILFFDVLTSDFLYIFLD